VIGAPAIQEPRAGREDGLTGIDTEALLMGLAKWPCLPSGDDIVLVGRPSVAVVHEGQRRRLCTGVNWGHSPAVRLAVGTEVAFYKAFRLISPQT